MKTALALLATLLLGAGLGYYYQARRHAEAVARAGAEESSWAAEKAALEQQLAEARRGAGGVRTVTRTQTATVTNRASAAELLQRLVRLNPDTGDETRNRTLRQVVHHLQLLADCGADGKLTAKMDGLADPEACRPRRQLLAIRVNDFLLHLQMKFLGDRAPHLRRRHPEVNLG